MATAELLVNELDKDLLLSRVQQLIFVDALAGFECQRCDRTLVRHYVAECGHKFCANCKRVLTQSKSNCPLAHSKKDIGDMDLQDVEFERKLYQLRAHCPNKSYGCPFVSQLKDLGGHLRVCKDTRDNALPVLIEGNNVVEAILRELSAKFDKLSFEVSSIKDETGRIDKNVKDLEMKVDKKMAEMINEKANVAEIETKLKSIRKEFEMFKINNQKEDVIEINRRIRTMNKETSDQNKKIRQELSFLKQETETNLSKFMENNSTDSSNLGQKIFNLETLILQRSSKMDCFTLADDKGNNFRPDFTWKINGLKEKLKQTTFEIKSGVFEWTKYSVRARAKIEVGLKNSNRVYLSLCFDEDNEKKVMALKISPSIYYVFRDRSGNKDARHRSVSQNQLWLPIFKSSNNFYETDALVSILTNGLYNVNDSIVIDLYVEPPVMAQQVYSYDGNLFWTVDNYLRRKQMAVEKLVFYQESPYFYTGPKGYRVQVVMWMDANSFFFAKCLTANICFLKGEHDDGLPLNYPHRTTITLFNRKDPTRNITKTVDKTSGKEKDYQILVCLDEEAANAIMNDTIVYHVNIKSIE